MSNSNQPEDQSTNEQIEFLQQTNEMMRSLMADVGHEVRTPLFGIAGFSEFLLKQDIGSLNNEQIKLLDSIHRSSRRLIEKFNYLFDISRIALSQEYDKYFEEVDLGLLREEIELPEFDPNTREKTPHVWTNKHLVTLILKMILSPLPYLSINREITLDANHNQDQVILRFTIKYDQKVSFLENDPRLICCQIGIKRLGGQLSWELPEEGKLLILLVLPVFKDHTTSEEL